MSIVPVTTVDLLHQAYTAVFEPTFPPQELGPFESIASGWENSQSRAWVALDNESVIGAAMCDVHEDTRTALLTYLALAPGRRGGGVGSALYQQVIDWVNDDDDTDLLFGEFEHPSVHVGSESAGDPKARLRFYERLGAHGLALPYFQPSIHGAGRVPGFILGVLAASGSVQRENGVDSAPVRGFLEANLVMNEGGVGDDDATRQLFDAATGDTVETISLSQPELIPVCRVA